MGNATWCNYNIGSSDSNAVIQHADVTIFYTGNIDKHFITFYNVTYFPIFKHCIFSSYVFSSMIQVRGVTFPPKVGVLHPLPFPHIPSLPFRSRARGLGECC